MTTCTRCGSYAINPHRHGRGEDHLDLCDVCYWRMHATLRGTRLQVLREHLDWEAFIARYPEAALWFDAQGDAT